LISPPLLLLLPLKQKSRNCNTTPKAPAAVDLIDVTAGASGTMESVQRLCSTPILSSCASSPAARHRVNCTRCGGACRGADLRK
jgi:hypothetical protein